MKKSKTCSFGLLSWFLVFSILAISVTASEEAIFRPFYTGYTKGTSADFGYANWTSENDIGISREWNLEAWQIEHLRMKIRFCLPYWHMNIFGWDYPYQLTLYFSLDNGKTFNESRTIGVPWLYYGSEWTSGWFFSDFECEFDTWDYYLFSPSTRIKFKAWRADNVYLANLYWGEAQEPIPPYDYKDEYGTYVQYYIRFYLEYDKEEIEYKGETVTFPYTKTKEKLKQSANMIIDCMQLSGCTNEVTDKQFGTDTWVILYSAEIAMMQLIDLCSVFPEEASDYLGNVKRFIAYLFSKQNTTDGSFPFILTDGDQHCWYNETADSWYGYDKIDSFSACAISLMRKYHDATNDTVFINQTWSEIQLCRTFIEDLMNFTYWLPVDGYHYDNDTGYVKSEMNWLHDCCEAYQGIKDYAYLEGIRGNSSGETYWNSYASNISDGIKTYFWNETLGRYSGMFYVNDGTQNTAKVYNIITPMIYGIEDNETRVSMTVNAYVTWGILTGRYYELKYAEDYNVFNEYSAMSGMIYSSFYNLITEYNYSQKWMKDKFLEVSKFLFCNPIYPLRNLQNANGFLDYVNLINYTYAEEYARLIEASAWFIDGFLKLKNMSSLFVYDASELMAINDTLIQQSVYWNTKYTEFEQKYGYAWNISEHYFNLWVNWLKNNGTYVAWYDYMFLKELFDEGYLGDVPWWEEWEPPSDWIDKYSKIKMPNYVPLFCGIFGFILLCLSPLYCVRKFIKGEYSEGLGYSIVMGVIAIGLIIAWLWG